jgi:hypothetical protein
LRSIGNYSSLPFLVRALDFDLCQHDALIALYRITGYPGGTSWSEFVENPKAEKEKWRKWWQTQGKSKEKFVPDSK